MDSKLIFDNFTDGMISDIIEKMVCIEGKSKPPPVKPKLFFGDYTTNTNYIKNEITVLLFFTKRYGLPKEACFLHLFPSMKNTINHVLKTETYRKTLLDGFECEDGIEYTPVYFISSMIDALFNQYIDMVFSEELIETILYDMKNIIPTPELGVNIQRFLFITDRNIGSSYIFQLRKVLVILYLQYTILGDPCRLRSQIMDTYRLICHEDSVFKSLYNAKKNNDC